MSIVLSATALIVSLAGIAPADAVNTVKRALSAKDADAVDGISASRSPRPRHLLALGANGKFPRSVITTARGPRGAAGPPGPAGPAGPEGARGPSDVLMVAPNPVSLSPNASVPVNVASMANVPAGSYLAIFTGEATLRAGTAGLYVTCEIRVNGARVSTTRGIVGDAYGGDEVMSDMIAITREFPFDVTVACFADQNTASLGTSPSLHFHKLALLRTERVQMR